MFRETEELVRLGLKDTTSRDIKSAERVDVICIAVDCPNKGQEAAMGNSVFNLLLQKYSKNERGWECNDCARRRIGEKAAVNLAKRNKLGTNFYSKRQLERLGVIDRDSGQIVGTEAVQVRCHEDGCSQIGTISLKALVSKYRAGNLWKCHEHAYGVDFSEKCRKRMKKFYRTPEGKEHAKNLSIRMSEVCNTPERKEEFARITHTDEAKAKRLEHMQRYHDDKEWCRNRIEAAIVASQTEEAKEKRYRTNIDKYGSGNLWKSEVVIETRRNNWLEKTDGKYTNPRQLPEVQEKIEQTCVERYGAKHPMFDKNVRKKVFKSRDSTGPEKFLIEFFTNRNIDFSHEETVEDVLRHHWDFVIRKNGKVVMVIDVDGEFTHGYNCDPYTTKQQSTPMDEVRVSSVPNDICVMLIDSKKVKEAIPQILANYDNFDFNKWADDLYNECKNSPFPYRTYSESRMRRDWDNLCKRDNFTPQQNPTRSIVTHFHPSIYRCSVKGKRSPLEAWFDPKLLRKCIDNRFLYKSDNISSYDLVDGFAANKIAPSVSVFRACFARELLITYAPDSVTVVDPFSGFSGRMMGTLSLDKIYTGYDINPVTISESLSVLKFLGRDANLSVADSLSIRDENEYDVLLTCPPYGDKEDWGNKQKPLKTTDEYVEACLRKFKAKIYIFVVDKTEKYKKNIVQHIKYKSHINATSECVLVFYRT